jgi:ABC-type sugar transport systems, ATPase components
MNFLHGTLVGNQFVTGSHKIEIPKNKLSELERLGYSGEIILGVRPEHVKDGTGQLPIKVELVELIGSESIIFGLLDDTKIVCKTGVRTDINIGDTIMMNFEMGTAHFFDKETEVRIPIQK